LAVRIEQFAELSETTLFVRRSSELALRICLVQKTKTALDSAALTS
jgi:hypothetical protein